MDKIKRVLAILMVIALLGMYLWSFIAAFFARPEAGSMFMASVLTTIFFPILLFIYMETAKYLKGRGVENNTIENEEKTGEK